MTAIVTTHYRYKRPPRKRKAVVLEVPAIVTAMAPKPRKSGDPPILRQDNAAPPAPIGANDDAKLKSAIVTARKPGKRYSTAPDMTPEEHQRRGDGAEAMFREFKRLIAEKVR